MIWQDVFYRVLKRGDFGFVVRQAHAVDAVNGNVAQGVRRIADDEIQGVVELGVQGVFEFLGGTESFFIIGLGSTGFSVE